MLLATFGPLSQLESEWRGRDKTADFKWDTDFKSLNERYKDGDHSRKTFLEIHNCWRPGEPVAFEESEFE